MPGGDTAARTLDDLPSVGEGIRGDFEAFRRTYHRTGRGAAALAAFLAQPATGLLLLARIAAQGSKPLSLLARRRMVRRYSCDVEQGARLSPGLLVAHPIGIVIGGGVSIETGTKLHQHVTIGVHHGGSPHVERGVYIFSGAVIVGPVTVGAGAVIGANSYVCADVPSGATVPAGTRWTPTVSSAHVQDAGAA